MRVHHRPVRVERVPSLPHGGTLFIDAPPGAVPVVWIRDGQEGDKLAALIDSESDTDWHALRSRLDDRTSIS
jgi:hypothetical protein